MQIGVGGGHGSSMARGGCAGECSSWFATVGPTCYNREHYFLDLRYSTNVAPGWGIMNYSGSHRLQDRVRVDLIEADVDMAFGLIDDAREEFHQGNHSYAQQALEEARRALADIEARLRELAPERSSPFGPLVDELRKSMQETEAECS